MAPPRNGRIRVSARPTKSLGRFGMFSWKTRFVVAAALAVSVAGGYYGWFYSLGW